MPAFPPNGTLSPADVSYTPPFAHRFYLKSEAFDDAVFAVRRRQNVNSAHNPVQIPDSMGGTTPRQIFLHNNMGFSGISKSERPEYFAYKDGTRRSEQICMSHPDVRRLVWSTIEGGAATMPSNHIVVLAQNDSHYPCECPRCSILRHEGDSPETVAALYSLEAVQQTYGVDVPLGTIERPVLGPPSVMTVSFANDIAARLAPVRPDLRVGTLAYSMTMMPPRQTPVRDNVIIQFATYHSCVLHDYDDATCPLNFQASMYLEGWRNLCNNISVWFYDHNHLDVLSVVPNLRIQAKTLQYFVDSNVEGIFTQGAPRNNGFSDLRAYWLTSLHWNPNLDPDVLINEFLDIYYGPGPAVYIRQWLDLYHDSVDDTQHTNIGYQPWHINVDPVHGEFGVDNLFAQAIAGAADGVTSNRIEKVSITAHRLRCEPLIWNAHFAAGTASARGLPLSEVEYPLSPAEKDEQLAWYQVLLALCQKHGINQFQEGINFIPLNSAIENYLGLPGGTL